jgi:dephospho-CoA kinase
MIVGLTGGIGSGKTTVAKFFKELGVPVYNSDKQARKLMKNSKKLKKAITDLLGENAYKGKKLNKKYISDKIFNDSSLLTQLNAIVHPAVRKHFLSWVEKKKAPYVVQETALIFENKAQDFYDRIILVVAPEANRIQRVMERDGSTEQQVKDRLKNQLTDEEKLQGAHFVIENTTLAETKEKVGQLNREILKML